VIVAARSLGLELPRDLSVVVFAPVGTWMGGYNLSVAAIPTAEMGHRAVRMLLQRLKSTELCCPPEAIPYGLSAGQTVGPPPSKSSKSSS
jgi:DNA-binding LacI/PurR family transcriptional regulator